MKPKVFPHLILSIAGLLLMGRPCWAHYYADIIMSSWSSDESKFILGFTEDTEGGNENPYSFELYDVASGKLLKRYGAGHKKSLKEDRQFLSSAWLAPDPRTYSSLDWPGWPPYGRRHYESRVTIDWKEYGIKLVTTANETDKDVPPDVSYRLFIKGSNEKNWRRIAEWVRPNHYDLYKALNFTLGGIAMSPSNKWLCIMLRRFDFGYEGPEARPIPLFFTVQKIIGPEEGHAIRVSR